MKKDLLLISLLILPAVTVLLQPGYFSMHDDLQAFRQRELDICARDLQLPCRWVPEMGFGFGYPLFNYYPPLPYLLGEPFRLLGFQNVDTVKIVGILGFAVCAFNMYLLAREFWSRGGGFLSALLYTYAPYHSVDFYVRGAMNEFWAMAIFPAVFYTSYKLISSGQRKYVPLLSLSVAALMLSHNPMLMIFAPVALVWCLFWLWKSKTLKSLGGLAVSGLWAFGLAAFFTLPVIFEARYAHIETLTIGYFNFLAHFLDLKQIFLRINWGYGESVLGPGDTMSFALGYLQWIIPALVLIAMIFSKKIREYKSLILLLLLFTVTALFMSHYRSTPVWLKLDFLKYLQFPWRFLTVAVFSASLLGGALILINKKLLPLLLLLLLLLNANYFRPRAWYPDMTDAAKFSGDSWRLQTTASIFDYLPVYAPLPPANAAGGDLGITGGSGSFERLAKTSDFQEYRVNISSPSAVAELQTFYFPGWRVWLDGREVKIDPSRDPLLGRMQVDVPRGEHIITARFTNTPVRTAGDILSLASWLSLALTGVVYCIHKCRYRKSAVTR
jgi:6-pyruvoyl-tetrahydropterin synthase related domain